MRTQTGRLGDCFGLTYRPFCLPSRKEDVRPVRLVYGKHASRYRIPGDEREPRATANWNGWKHLRRPTALLAPCTAAAVVPVQDVTTFRGSKGRGQHFAADQLIPVPVADFGGVQVGGRHEQLAQ